MTRLCTQTNIQIMCTRVCLTACKSYIYLQALTCCHKQKVNNYWNTNIHALPLAGWLRSENSLFSSAPLEVN